MSSRVVHFEIPADDPEAAARFYTTVFGWQIQKWEGPMEYWVIKTGEGMGIDGGLMRRSGPMDRVVNTVNVGDVVASTQNVRDSGGSIVGDKMTISGIGDLQYACEPQGNLFGMLEPILAETAAGTP